MLRPPNPPLRGGQLLITIVVIVFLAGETPLKSLAGCAVHSLGAFALLHTLWLC